MYGSGAERRSDSTGHVFTVQLSVFKELDTVL